MNTRVDLILKAEQRSASIINVRMLSRLATVLAPCVIAVIILLNVLNMIALNSKVKMAEADWEAHEPKKAEAQALRERLNRNSAVLHNINSWSRARFNWGNHLLAIQQAIRPKLQLDRIQIAHGLRILDGKHPARVYKGTIDGLGIGPSARSDVEHLRSTLTGSAAFTQEVDKVAITFGADPEQRENRIFKLDVDFIPLVFSDETP